MAQVDGLQLVAWRSVRRTYNRIVRALDSELEKRAGLSLRGYEVLVLLSRVPGCAIRMSDLAASVILSPSGLTRLVDQLVSRGLVERRQDPADARAQFAVISAAGKAACRKATVAYNAAVMSHFGARLTEEQLRAVVDALAPFLADADARSVRAGQPRSRQAPPRQAPSIDPVRPREQRRL